MSRIVVVHHTGVLGGGSTSFLDILEMLRSDHEVVPVCPAQPTFLKEMLKASGYSPIVFEGGVPSYLNFNGAAPLTSRSFWLGLGRSLSSHHGWVRLFDSIRPDLVVLNSSVMVTLAPIALKVGARVVCVVRETIPSSRVSLRSRLQYWMMNRWLNGVVFISEFDRRVADLTTPRTSVVRDVIRPGSLRLIERADALGVLGIADGFNVVFAGGSAWFKGLDVVLEAMRVLPSNVQLVVAGCEVEAFADLPFDGLRMFSSPAGVRHRRRVSRLLASEELRDRVFFVGSQDDMSVLYSAADAVVFPSLLPHQSRPAYEAGMFALPIVITDFEETREFVVNRVNGLTFERGKSADLAEAILDLYADEEFRRRLGVANSDYTKRLHDFHLERGNLLGFLATVMDR